MQGLFPGDLTTSIRIKRRQNRAARSQCKVVCLPLPPLRHVDIIPSLRTGRFESFAQTYFNIDKPSSPQENMAYPSHALSLQAPVKSETHKCKSLNIHQSSFTNPHSHSTCHLPRTLRIPTCTPPPIPPPNHISYRG